jgi:hypothetical protein
LDGALIGLALGAVIVLVIGLLWFSSPTESPYARAAAASVPTAAARPGVLVRVYEANQQADAVTKFEADAARLARDGYVPVAQSWAQGQWGCGAWLVALLLCIVLIGILVFIYMLIVKPEGTLTVTYRLDKPAAVELPAVEAPPVTDDTMACPRCAETIKRAAKMCRFCQLDLTGDGLG